MCQLLGVNCNAPTDIMFSFEGFRRRGGTIGHHVDGLGIGLFEDEGARLFRDNKPDANSPAADLVRVYQIKSRNVIVHIRKASQGQTSLANTHPFTHEMQDEYWLSAHDGHLIDFFPEQDEYYHAVGSTDSKRAFCSAPSRLCSRFVTKPELEVLFDTIAGLTHEIRRYGLSNFMMFSDDCLFAHASTSLRYIVRKAPFGKVRLLDNDVMIDSSEVITPNDEVSVIATLPLTCDKTQSQLVVNELVIFQDGDIVLNDRPDDPVYTSAGEGLEITHAVGVSV